MQVKDITDEQCRAAAEQKGNVVETLMAMTGAPEKVCLRKIEQLVRRGKMNYGVSPYYAWWEA